MFKTGEEQKRFSPCQERHLPNERLFLDWETTGINRATVTHLEVIFTTCETNKLYPDVETLNHYAFVSCYPQRYFLGGRSREDVWQHTSTTRGCDYREITDSRATKNLSSESHTQTDPGKLNSVLDIVKDVFDVFSKMLGIEVQM
ncbi:hypothetical protein DPMN_111458 [Dreissena polymorpha]|uniref:Exonuclease domain-containing protein n=1 Tax=Dreissena polymorpha TaxID=45954 RepID=A0A9D4QPT4_DREPO|nr:hypothetical protein DPMN_111458 [Dreissena polymorpha]